MDGLIDIGLNLMHSSFKKDRQEIIEEAAKVGVSKSIITGTNVNSSKIASEYASKYDQYTRELPIQQGNLFVNTKHYTLDYYNSMEKSNFEVYVDNISEDSIEIQWDKFGIIGGRFESYSIYVSESKIYDVYTNTIDEGATKVVEIRDIHRTSYRLTELIPGRVYQILVVIKDTNGFKEYNELKVSTLAPLMEAPREEV